MIDTRERLSLHAGPTATYFSLRLLQERGIAKVARLPVSPRVLLESVLRNQRSAVRGNDTNPLTEAEMLNNRPTRTGSERPWFRLHARASSSRTATL
jgi:aconitase A